LHYLNLKTKTYEPNPSISSPAALKTSFQAAGASYPDAKKSPCDTKPTAVRKTAEKIEPEMKKLYLLLILSCMTVAGYAQQQIRGTVSDQNGVPVIGATVIIRNSTTGTTTDIEGHFQINAKPGDMLDITYIGYKSAEQPVGPATEYTITLTEDAEVLEEVVVTGYMSEKKADLTGAVSVVKMKDVADTPTGNVLSSLQGRVPGVNIITDGTPGGMNTSTLVRGTTTVNNSSPLYVIDGVMTRDNIASILSSNDVESIQVLKDAASAAIYGAQAANGVIIITTKRAKKGEIHVDFNMSLTAQTFATGMDLLDAQQWGECYWAAYKYANNGATPNSIVYGNGEKPVLQPYYYEADGIRIPTGNTDWAEEIFSTALMQDYSLTLSKGSENGSTSLSVNYLNQDGMCRNTDFERFNTRLSSDYRFLNDRLRIGESIAVNHWTRHFNPGGIEENVIAQHPAIPVYDDRGGYAGGYVDILGDKPNLVRLTDNEANNRHAYWRVFGNAYIEIEPVKHLTLKSNFGVNYYNEFNSVFEPAWREGSRSSADNSLEVTNSYNLGWVWSNTIAYACDIDRHSFSVLLGTEAKKEHAEDLLGRGKSLAIEDLDYRYLNGITKEPVAGNGASNYAMISYFAKANYSYDNRYLLSATVRRDASSRFGSKKNSAVFPSVSAGWRISQERFMNGATDWLSDLKLRASWGVNGNDMIDNEATYTKYVVSLKDAGYNISGDGTTLAPGVYKIMSANPNLRWEQTQQLNVGLDASLLDGRLGFSVDYFDKDTKDMLIRRDYIATIGEGGYYWYNGISMNNKGLEMVLSWRDRKRDFNYEVVFNLSYNKNKITDLPSDIYYTYGGGNGTDKTIVGQPFGSWMGYRTDGLFRTQQEVDDYLAAYDVQIGAPGVGRIRYRDIDGNGVIDTRDQTWLGSDQPRWMGGLNFSCSWKGIDFGVFFNGMVRDAWNNSKYYTDLFQCWTGNHSTRLLDAAAAYDRFTATGYYDGKIPALTTVDSNNENRGSDFYIEDGSFIKLKTFTLGYTFPSKWTSRIKMRNARIYFQMQNVFTLTGYTGADPEGLGYTYPQPRTYTFGLSFGF